MDTRIIRQESFIQPDETEITLRETEVKNPSEVSNPYIYERLVNGHRQGAYFCVERCIADKYYEQARKFELSIGSKQ